MSGLDLIAVLLTLSALFGVLNARTLRLPNTIGILVFALILSAVLAVVDPLIPHFDLRAAARHLLRAANLPQTLLKGLLSLLLFAGALEVDLDELWARRASVLALALVATLLSVGLFGGAMWIVYPWVGAAVPLIWCLVLGAIVAPTDPVSVVGMLRRLGLPARIQAVFAGESLFNDGIAVVLFSVFLAAATGTGQIHALSVAKSFAVEAGGGGAIGFGLGYLAVLFMRTVDDTHLLLMISLALATSAFSLADIVGASGPIAVVVAGLMLVSRHGRQGVAEGGRDELLTFWSLMDEILNSMLFLLIGFEVLIVGFHLWALPAVGIAIVLSTVVRAVSVLLSTLPIRLPWRDRSRALVILTWGSLRGGISVALGLSLPDSPVRIWLLSVTYGLVVFTIIGQGLTVERLASRVYSEAQ